MAGLIDVRSRQLYINQTATGQAKKRTIGGGEKGQDT